MSTTAPLLDTRTESLAPWVEAGVLAAADVHVTSTIARATGETEPDVLLAIALAARAPRFGHVCMVPDEIADTIVVDDAQLGTLDDLPWPEAGAWTNRIAASAAVRAPGHEPGEQTRPLVLDDGRLYLERYWRFEQRVADDLIARAGADGGLVVPSDDLDAALDAWFGPEDPATPDRQRQAARVALTRRLAVVAGGPGTGKTRTIARLLIAAHDLAIAQGRTLEVALAAPTGKAAARMTEAVTQEAAAVKPPPAVTEALAAAEGSTLHRLLGGGPTGRFRHHRANPLPHDVVIVDEASMVSLPLMARLLDAVRPEATVVLVGDSFQLASIEAGAVLGEVVGPAATGPAAGPLAGAVVVLDRVHRFAADSAIAALADAVRVGDVERALAVLGDGGSDEVTWVGADDTAGVTRLQQQAADAAVAVVHAAGTGDGARALELATDLKVLCATRRGDLGTYRWTDRIEDLAATALPQAGIGRRWYVGRPVVVTSNDYPNRLFNGDVGVVIARDNQPTVAFPATADTVRVLAPAQLADTETWWAMTIHKSQGSEFPRIVVALPPPPSPILTRELLYTAITRAKTQMTIVASEASVRAAIERRIARASGLRTRLWGPDPAS
ncbi:MAG: exodeoxyribonuclease V subunit alpha [Actinomycetota bacterium]